MSDDDRALGLPGPPEGPEPPGFDRSLSGVPQDVLARICRRVAGEVVGYDDVVRLLYIALVSDGHVLLEGAPGIAKTMLVRRFASSLALGFKRIQFTPDMLPSDIIGTVVLNPASRAFEYRRGPLFTHLLLADEINRAPPKVQSALLEAMQERQVTVDGTAYPLPRPFMVIATENPVEQEGTYPLPEAELDRLLFRLLLGYPSEENEREVIRGHLRDPDRPGEPAVADSSTVAAHRRDLNEVYVSDELVEYIARLVRTTREDPRVLVGASPRASVQLARAARAEALLSGRVYVAPEDVKRVAFWVLNHRLTLEPDYVIEHGGEERSAAGAVRDVLTEILDQVPVPR